MSATGVLTVNVRLVLHVTPFMEYVPVPKICKMLLKYTPTAMQATTLNCEIKLKNGKECMNVAKYSFQVEEDVKLACGVHSSKVVDRRPLKHEPRCVVETEDRDVLIANATTSNLYRDQSGKVTCSKYKMMRKAPHVDGYVTIFPNYNHGKRSDGVGMKELSPMFLGPVQHSQPGVVEAANLENFWQGSKLFPAQTTWIFGDITEDHIVTFRKEQAEILSSIKPARHNPRATVSKKKVLPLGWVLTNVDGTIDLLGIIASRRYYCKYYEELASKVETGGPNRINDLRTMLTEGYNLNIVGYDSPEECPCIISKEWLHEKYSNTSCTFGHELCIATMLVCEKEDYPWQ